MKIKCGKCGAILHNPQEAKDHLLNHSLREIDFFEIRKRDSADLYSDEWDGFDKLNTHVLVLWKDEDFEEHIIIISEKIYYERYFSVEPENYYRIIIEGDKLKHWEAGMIFKNVDPRRKGEWIMHI